LQPLSPFPLWSFADYLPIVLKYGIITDVKVRDVIKMIEEDGWYLSRTRGSHRQYKHSSKPGLITIAGKPNHDLAKGTLNSILKKAGLKQ
jgi:predicted RNA binding protein YcfA (HicA-like mRNA interferase family)